MSILSFLDTLPREEFYCHSLYRKQLLSLIEDLKARTKLVLLELIARRSPLAYPTPVMRSGRDFCCRQGKKINLLGMQSSLLAGSAGVLRPVEL
jgi:hypothetical protein